jgi:hypothetical protein
MPFGVITRQFFTGGVTPKIPLFVGRHAAEMLMRIILKKWCNRFGHPLHIQCCLATDFCAHCENATDLFSQGLFTKN